MSDSDYLTPDERTEVARQAGTAWRSSSPAHRLWASHAVADELLREAHAALRCRSENLLVAADACDCPACRAARRIDAVLNPEPARDPHEGCRATDCEGECLDASRPIVATGECARCYGKGEWGAWSAELPAETCPDCNGRGVSHQPEGGITGAHTHTKRVECARCGGTGNECRKPVCPYPSSHPCPDCNGTGKKEDADA